jgi:predicted deacylase
MAALRSLAGNLVRLAPLVSLLGTCPPVQAETIFTGDVLHGAPVITELSLEDVPHSAVTRYYLRVPSVSGGWDMHLPLFVARGAPETLHTGKKLSVSASVHGDELNPVRVTQRLLEILEGTSCGDLNGTIIGMPTLNPTGNYLSQRNYYTASGSGTLSNVNRLFPGSDPFEGASGPEALAWIVWNNVWGNTSNVDVAIDLRELNTLSNGLYAGCPT